MSKLFNWLKAYIKTKQGFIDSCGLTPLDTLKDSKVFNKDKVKELEKV